ncbi:MAG: cytidylate kinase-like family protein [Sphaerochaetaceae bacterium]|nr:cytidylate kinase-like family protein [Sphaerochaetaceae bacterium]
MGNKIIAIGREFGSGGREIGVRVAKRLGIKFYDKELLHLTAEQSRFSEKNLENFEEKRPSFLSSSSVPLFGSVMRSSVDIFPSFYQLSTNDQIFIDQSNCIKQIADDKGCVIVGRCAGYVLSDNPDLVNVFICANLEDRINRKLALQKEECEKGKKELSYKEMEKLAKYIDKERSRYYEYYTHERWGDSRNYDLSINASSVGIDGAVELILCYIKNEGASLLLPD